MRAPSDAVLLRFVQFVQVFTRSAATVDARRGGKFLLLDGSVSGEFTELVRPQSLSDINLFHVGVTRWFLSEGSRPEDWDEVALQDLAQRWVWCHEVLLLLHADHLSPLVAPSEHCATIRLELVDRGDETELELEGRGVPAAEEETTREGWRRFYLQAIKQTFGYWEGLNPEERLSGSNWACKV